MKEIWFQPYFCCLLCITYKASLHHWPSRYFLIKLNDWAISKFLPGQTFNDLSLKRILRDTGWINCNPNVPYLVPEVSSLSSLSFFSKRSGKFPLFPVKRHYSTSLLDHEALLIWVVTCVVFREPLYLRVCNVPGTLKNDISYMKR